MRRAAQLTTERQKAPPDEEKAPPPPPPPPHQATPQIPQLSSAPPSANLEPTDLSSASSNTSNNNSTGSPVRNAVPLPPPPVRPAAAAAFAATPPVHAPKPTPLVRPLPPPPVVAPTTTTTTTPAQRTQPSHKFPLPPPPPAVVQQPPPPPPVRINYPPPPKPAPRPTNQSAQPMTLLARRQTHIPVLLVATEAAHHVAWKNGVRLTDLFTGLWTGSLASTNNTTLPAFRSISRTLPLQWEDLTVQFIDTVVPTTANDAQAALQAAAALQPTDGNLPQELDLLEDQVDNLLQTGANVAENAMDWHAARQRQLEQVTKDAFGLTSPLTLPWMGRYRQALDQSTNALEHDLLACPPLVVYVCTTHEPVDVVETLQSLESPHHLPAQFTHGLWDTQYLRQQFLVLHDNAEGPLQLDEAAMLRLLHEHFGPSAATLLRTNSISRETAVDLAREEASDLWGGGGTLGNCLSVSDRVKFRQYLSHLLTTALLPAMERRIADLNIIVSDRKKGVKNVFKSLWRTGKKDEETEVTAPTPHSPVKGGEYVYRADSIEAQTRLLADSLFLMRDYEAAYGTYRLIRDDYKQDRAMAHYGSCQEMMALCLHFMDPYGRSREMFTNIENALLSYSKAAEEERAKMSLQPGRPSMAPPSTRLATRLCLVMIHSRHICAGRHLEVADLLASASAHETALGAAVLLEQASAHYFRNEMFRKYSFHMLMSGHMYRAAEQEHHAFRCFTSALCIYRDSRWEELHNHVRSALAAQLFSMGRMSIALQLYAKLLGSTNGGRVSVKSQQKFVTHLLEICNEHPKKALAAADRMAASPTLEVGERDKARKERSERIVQVIRFTKTSKRILELPNMDLPLVDDASVTVIADEGGTRSNDEEIRSIGKARRGSPEVWDQMSLEASAELISYNAESSQGKNDDITNRLLARIDNTEIRRVVAEIDKAKTKRAMQERAKRSASYKPKPPVRALQEPIKVEFTVRNPLGIPVDLNDIQLVARMTSSDHKVCTNEDAIKITPLASYDRSNTWNFPTTDETFYAADYCRISADSSESSTIRWKSAEDSEPFFVVTKETLTIDPESKRVVSLSLCPLVKGDLEIVGMRCRIFDDIWVFHPFNVKGELLQNTRANRANRVRGESLLLKARIGEGMPCLTAEILAPMSTPGESVSSVFQGQISKWNLRLSNVGTAPAKNLFLKSNSPWLTIWDGQEMTPSADAENKAVSFVVSPSGTLMQVPISDEDLKVDGELQPGESFEVAVDIRPPKAGKQCFYMLFRYDLAGDHNGTHRWLRKMLEVPVYPSIECHASVSPSFATVGEHVLSVDVSNLRNDKPHGLDLQLSSITLASRSYGFEPILPPIDSGVKRLCNIGWQDRLSLHYKVSGPFEEAGACQLNRDDLAYGESGLVTRQPAAESTQLDFLRLERAFNEFRHILISHRKALARAAMEQDDQAAHPRSIADIRRENTSVVSDSESDLMSGSTPHATSLLKLIPKTTEDENAVLICNWRSPDNLINGVHFITGISTIPFANECPIAVTARYQSTVPGNFQTGPVCVPFEITFRNRLVKDSVKFAFAADDQTDFDLSGATAFESVLSGGECKKVTMTALLHKCGIYNIQMIRITCKNVQPEPFLFPVQWMVTVLDTAHASM